MLNCHRRHRRPSRDETCEADMVVRCLLLIDVTAIRIQSLGLEKSDLAPHQLACLSEKEKDADVGHFPAVEVS